MNIYYIFLETGDTKYTSNSTSKSYCYPNIKGLLALFVFTILITGVLTIVYWLSIRCRYVVQILGLNIVHIVCFIKKLQTVQTTGRKMFILSPHFPSHKTLYIITSAYSTIHSNICIPHIQYICKKQNSDFREFRFSNKLSDS